MLILLL